MQLDVDIELTLRFPGMKSIEKQKDQSESNVLVYQVQLTDFGKELVDLAIISFEL